MLNPYKLFTIVSIAGLLYTGCKTPVLVQVPQAKTAPLTFNNSSDTASSAAVSFKTFFKDAYLTALIDTALKNNQELSIALQEIEIARNEVRIKHGAILPRVEAGGGIGIEKVGRYTSQGAGDASAEITPGKEVPEWLADFKGGLFASWEVDIWKKLRNSKKAAYTRYLASAEGRNFVITNLVAEIANSYYELLALDNQLDIVKQTITLQKNALEIVKVQKQAAAATELAVKKFEAEVLGSQSMEYDILQKIQERENAINFLLGRYPQHIKRDTTGLLNMQPLFTVAGIPSQLLQNRPDIRQAELELAATKLDVAVAKAEFYPSFNISGVLGFQAFNPTYLVKLPQSVLFGLAGDLAGPLINKHAITAEYYNANARQIQALYNYERSILNAYIEVSNQLSGIQNFAKKYDLKTKEVDALVKSIDIAGDLFKNARADYLEVLMTQRDALESKIELVETKLSQFNAVTNVYRALGGGWK
jgi:outer membrane protein, multidrug efflux system